MTIQTITGTPRLPRVNLLPPEMGAARRLRQVQGGLLGLVALSLGVVGALYLHAHGGVAQAQQQFDDAQRKNVTLQSQLAGLQGVTKAKAQVQQAEGQLQSAMGQDIRWSRYLKDLTLNTPANVWYEQTTFTVAGGAPGGAPASTLAASGAVGTVTFAGQALTHMDVAALLVQLGKEKGFVNPYFTSSAEQTAPGTTTQTVKYQATTSVDSSALCGDVCTKVDG